MSEEITSKSLSELAALIRQKQLSPVDVAEAFLRYIEAVNPRLNAIATVSGSVMDDARHAEQLLMNGEKAGPLHGVPVTIKDTLETAALLTTAGSTRLRDYTPLNDAPAVANLKRAGAIVLGKTNVPEMAMTYETDNRVFGRTLNPHDPDVSPGGSSGGEAVAVATCLSPGGLGSDLTGSIRIPAMFCGVFGLKPTIGVVPCDGHIPRSIGPLSLAAVTGPIARSVGDLHLLLNAARGFSPKEPFSAPCEPNSADDIVNNRWQVSWYVDDGNCAVTEEMQAAIVRAVGIFSDSGLEVSEDRPPSVDRGPKLWSGLFGRSAASYASQLYQDAEDEAGPAVKYVIESYRRSGAANGDEFIAAWCERDRLRAKLIDFLGARRIIVCPVGATNRLALGARTVNVNNDEVNVFRAFGYCQTFNVFGLPSVSVPVGRSADGLPISVQIVGAPFTEGVLLSAAQLLEDQLGGWQRPIDLFSR